MKDNIPTEIKNAIGKLPTWPEVVSKVVRMTNKPDWNTREISETIARDPAFSVRLLKIVNSPYYGFKSRINSISHAVNLIGIRNLRNLAVAISAISATKKFPIPSGPFHLQKYIRHAAAVATGCRILGSHLSDTDEGMLFTAGILHDIGKLPIIAGMPGKWFKTLSNATNRKIPLFLAEREEFGFDHSAVSALTLEYWKLPETITRLVTFHHDTVINSSGDLSIIDKRSFVIIGIANHVAHALGMYSDVEFNVFDIESPTAQTLLALSGGLEKFEDTLLEEISYTEDFILSI
jgi:HD-like signal output (HDOD) protein